MTKEVYWNLHIKTKQKQNKIPNRDIHQDFNWILHVSAREEYTRLSLNVKMCILVEFSLHKSAQILMLKAVWK